MIERGRASMELAKYNKELIGKERYSVIRYEDITQNLEKEMRKLADFIGISFSEKLMSPIIVRLLGKVIILVEKTFTNLPKKMLDDGKKELIKKKLS